MIRLGAVSKRHLIAMKHIVMIGPPGSGKGTQSRRLASKGYIQISTGDLLRAEIKKDTDLGREIALIITKGHLVNDTMALALISANFNPKNLFIFDGFPRTEVQAKMLDDQILNDRPKVAFEFRVDLKKLELRLENRRTCDSCGEIYNLILKPSDKSLTCNKCGGLLSHRKDDNKDAIETRINVYQQSVSPILNYYRARNELVVLDADLSESEINEVIKTHIN